MADLDIFSGTHSYYDDQIDFWWEDNFRDGVLYDLQYEAIHGDSNISGWATSTTSITDPFWGLVGGPNPIPEPTTMLLLGCGLIGLAGFRRRFKKS